MLEKQACDGASNRRSGASDGSHMSGFVELKTENTNQLDMPSNILLSLGLKYTHNIRISVLGNHVGDQINNRFNVSGKHIHLVNVEKKLTSWNDVIENSVDICCCFGLIGCLCLRGLGQ